MGYIKIYRNLKYMNKINSALINVLKRKFWIIALVFAINVGIKYWQEGIVTLANCAGIMLGIFFVTLLYVVVELWSNKKT